MKLSPPPSADVRSNCRMVAGSRTGSGEETSRPQNRKALYHSMPERASNRGTVKPGELRRMAESVAQICEKRSSKSTPASARFSRRRSVLPKEWHFARPFRGGLHFGGKFFVESPTVEQILKAAGESFHSGFPDLGSGTRSDGVVDAFISESSDSSCLRPRR